MILQAPQVARGRSILVYERAPGESEVRLYHEELLLGVTDAAPNGFWSLSVDLPDPGPEGWRWYYVQAVAHQHLRFKPYWWMKPGLRPGSPTCASAR